MSLDKRLLERIDQLISKGDRVKVTYTNPPNVFGFPTLDAGVFAEWQTQRLSFLMNLLGSEHVYVDYFKKQVVCLDQ